MRQIWEFFRSDFSTFWLGEIKCDRKHCWRQSDLDLLWKENWLPWYTRHGWRNVIISSDWVNVNDENCVSWRWGELMTSVWLSEVSLKIWFICHNPDIMSLMNYTVIRKLEIIKLSTKYISKFCGEAKAELHLRRILYKTT